MGKGSRLRTEQEVRRRAANDTFLQQAVYDELFAKDPSSANMFLLILEIEDYHTIRGIKPSFGNFTVTGEQLSHFMDKNRDVLKRLFATRFPDPTVYTFPGSVKNKNFCLTGKGKLQ
jgi:hypothetical protein